MLDTTSPESVRELAESVADCSTADIYAALCDAILTERAACRGIAADYCTSSSLECARLIFNRPSPRKVEGERR